MTSVGLPAVASTPEVVALDIGGILYRTTRQTLLGTEPSRKNFFHTLFSPNSTAYKDPVTNAYFIDRNGRLFEPILDYLRTGQWSCPPGLNEARVLEECEFYSIQPIHASRLDLSDCDLKQLISQHYLDQHDEVFFKLASFVCRRFRAIAAEGGQAKDMVVYIWDLRVLRGPGPQDSFLIYQATEVGKWMAETGVIDSCVATAFGAPWKTQVFEKYMLDTCGLTIQLEQACLYPTHMMPKNPIEVKGQPLKVERPGTGVFDFVGLRLGEDGIPHGYFVKWIPTT